jgi:hypothetical protein
MPRERLHVVHRRPAIDGRFADDFEKIGGA